MAGYNPPTNDALTVLTARNRALESAQEEALRAMGTQPFQAVKKLTRQLEVLQEQADLLAATQATIPIVLTNTADGNNFASSGTILQTQIVAPEGKTRVYMLGIISGTYRFTDTAGLITPTHLHVQLAGVNGAEAPQSTYWIGDERAIDFSGAYSRTVAVTPGQALTYRMVCTTKFPTLKSSSGQLSALAVFTN